MDTGTNERGLLIFDGDCGFCTTSARFASRWVDRRHRYDIQPWQQVDLAPFGLTEEDCIAAAQFVRRDGTVVAAHLAIAEGLKHGALPWRPLGHAMTLPGVSCSCRHGLHLGGGPPLRLAGRDARLCARAPHRGDGGRVGGSVSVG